MQFSRRAVCHVYTFYQELNVQPKVKGLEQYTSWKVRVPECVLLEKYEHQHVHVHIHIHNHAHIHFPKYMYQNMCVYVVGWLVVWLGGVVWCDVVC